jgi:hypothetical protein
MSHTDMPCYISKYIFFKLQDFYFLLQKYFLASRRPPGAYLEAAGD